MRPSRRLLLSQITGAGAFGLTGIGRAEIHPTDQIIAAERAFDAYTSVHGYARGFARFSTSASVGFNPRIFPYHTTLQQTLNQTPPPPEVPSKLRWWPHRVGAARSGDFGFDLGGWKIDDKPGGGWFFTIWQKQADGSWLWLLDGGAGRTDDVTQLPSPNDLVIDPPASVSAAPLGDIKTLDQAHNARISTDGPVKPVMRALMPDALVSSDHTAPAITPMTQIAVLMDRPLTGYQTRGGGIAGSGDLGYSYGECLRGDGAFAGSYIRLWASADKPRLLVDIFLTAPKTA